MSCKTHTWFRRAGLMAALVMSFAAHEGYAREAAFLDPGSSSGGGNSSEAIRVEPKNEIDIGDSALNVARRTTLFFTNQTSAPIHIAKIAINSDSNVLAEISNDDCTKQGTLTTGSRCSVEVSITPNSGGAWSVEILLTHDGLGRITRAKITGKTTGSGSGEKKDSGLFLSTKDVKPIDFGEVEIGQGKTVRSALMVNDSPEAITLYSIDVIAAENGLERLDQGCAVDMELKPGESCPVTMVWTPTTEGHVSTDLIIRHSGRLGFAVIPIRGITKGSGTASGNSSSKENGKIDTSKSASIPMPPSKIDMDKVVEKIPAMSSTTLETPGGLHLIGTVGARGLFYKPDGTTQVAEAGDQLDLGSQNGVVVSVGAKSAIVTIDGKKKTLPLETVQALTDKARSGKSSNSSSFGDSKGSLSSSLIPSSAPLPTNSPSYGSGK